VPNVGGGCEQHRAVSDVGSNIQDVSPAKELRHALNQRGVGILQAAFVGEIGTKKKLPPNARVQEP